MKRKFAVALDVSNKEQNDEFRKFIKESNLGWWHWINNFWLLTDNKGKFSATDIRIKLNEIYPGVTCIVLSLDKDGDSWSGYGPNKPERSMFKWIRETWSKKLE